jgi:hypothetical protein
VNSSTKPFGESKFWNELMHGVYGPRQGGARIIVDAESGATGVGKTSAAVTLARLCSKAFGYDLQPADFTLSGAEYLQRWKEHPDEDQPSVLLLDELTGGGAADGRRAMSSGNVNLARSWEIMRKKRIITITTCTHWSDVDRKVQRLADYRVWCREKPIGTFRPYKVGTDFNSGAVRTERLDDRIYFPDVTDESDEFYQHLTRQKEALLDASTFDADDLVATDGGEEEDANDQPEPDDVRREEQLKTVLRAMKPWTDEAGMSTVDAAALVDYSVEWVRRRRKEWENGEHRSLGVEPS